MAGTYPLFEGLSIESARAGSSTPTRPMTVAGLFAGIGGIEEGLHRAGHKTTLLCEIEPAAQRVLGKHFAVTTSGPTDISVPLIT